MPSTFRSSLILALVVVLTGIGAGLGGMLLALLLHGIQHLAYGYSLDSLVSHETFCGASPLPHRSAVCWCWWCAAWSPGWAGGRFIAMVARW